MGAQVCLVQVCPALCIRITWLRAVAMGSKTVAAAFLCLVGVAAGAGCYCSCCNWAWCDNCQTGCCQGSMCSTPNCRTAPSPTPPPTPPPATGWVQAAGTGCCPDSTCGGNKLFFGQLPGGLAGCEQKCDSIGGVHLNKWVNDDSYCACYGKCDCSNGDSQGNCRRWDKQMPLDANATTIVATAGQQKLAITVSVI